MMGAAGDDPDGLRLRGLIVVLWRAGLRISEALALVETDLDSSAEPSSSAAAKAASGARSAWTAGPGNNSNRGLLTARLCRSARCSAFCVARHADDHAHRRACGRSCVTPPGGRGTTPVRAPPTSTRARRRDVPRRSSTPGHPAPAGTRRPRDHLGIPRRDRQHRDHPSRPRTTGTHDPGDRLSRTEALRGAQRKPTALVHNRRQERSCGLRSGASPDRSSSSPKLSRRVR